MNTADFEPPPLVGHWLDVLFYIFYAIVGLWLLLLLFDYWQRRSYRLSRVENTSNSAARPDFLSVDRNARTRQMETATTTHTDDKPEGLSSKTLNITRIAVFVGAFTSCLSAIALAFIQIENIEMAWQQISSWERLMAIVKTYPMGLLAACLLSIGAVVRFLLELRAKQLR